MSPAAAQRGLARALLPILLVLALLLPTSVWLVVRQEGPQVQGEAMAHLAAIARLKSDHISNWLLERRQDGQMLSQDAEFADHVRHLLAAPGAAAPHRAAVLYRFALLRDHYQYDSIDLLATDERVLASTMPATQVQPVRSGPGSDATRELALDRNALGQAQLRWRIPVQDTARPGQRAMALVQLRIAPLHFLFPVIQAWPTASPSGETLLVTREGDEVVFMNELRHRQNTSMVLRMKLSDRARPAVLALQSDQPGSGEGVDYRGVPVLAAWLPVPGTDWRVVTKVDKAEVLAPVRVLAWWVSGVALLALTALTLVLVLFWRQVQRVQRLEVQGEQARSDQLMEQLFSLPFVGIATGDLARAHWGRSNAHFCSIVGCTPSQLGTLRWADWVTPDELQADLDACRRILGGVLDAYSADRCIRRPDGRTVVVSMQLRAMADAAKPATRCIVVLQDITHRHQAERRIKRQSQLFATLSACNQAIAQCASEEALFARVCQTAVKLGGMRLAWIGALDPRTQRVRPLASFGQGAELLDTIEVSARADSVFGLGGMGAALREDRPVWVQDFLDEPGTAAWHDIAVRAQWRSAGALPLHRDDRVAGVFVLIAAQADAFEPDARVLLAEMASDLDCALANFAREAQRRRTEQLLKHSQSQLELVLKGSSDAPWDWNLVTQQFDYSPQGWHMLGYGVDEVPEAPCHWPALIHPQQQPLIEQLQQQVHASGVLTTSMELRLRHRLGHYVPVLSRGFVTRDETGWPVRITGTHMDLTTQHQEREVEAWRSHSLGLVASGLEVGQVLQLLLARLQELLPDAHAALWLQHARDGALQPRCAEAMEPWLTDLCDAGAAPEESLPLPCVMFDGADPNPPGLADSPLRWRFLRATGQAGLARSWSVPVRSSWGRVWGVLDLHRAQGVAPDAHACKLVDVMAHSVGLALDRHEAEAQQRLATQVFEHSRDGITITDAQCNIVLVNPAFCRITGYGAPEVLGRNPRVLASGKQDAQYYARMWYDINTHGLWQGEIWNRRKSGEVYPEWLTITRMTDTHGAVTHYVAIFSDITQKKSDEERIRWMAHFDPLTGLPNRALLGDRFAQAASSAQRTSQPLALMFVDLDHFKNVNDSLGHGVGDELLRGVAHRMRQQLREQDTVARLGGDEFVVLLPGTDAHGAAHLAHKLLGAVAAPLQVGPHELTVTPSIGIAMFPLDGADLGTLSQHADTAMYRAKHEGRNACRFFAPEMQRVSERHLLIEGALRRALERGHLCLHYQPQISLRSGGVTGVEALLRWQHPELGWVSPAEFIPLAEKSGLILSLGDWVLRTALAQLKAWTAAGLAPVTMAVNLSAVQFRAPNLPEQVGAMLSEAGLEPRHLELELTEGVASDDPRGATAIMDALHARGVCMSIDDFGTGYSSLSYLKRFKVYKLKIDQSFVREVTSNPEDKAIVCAIIHLARNLGLRTIAEGVETPEQLAFLADQGCDEVQGYFCSRPLPAPACEQFLRERQQALVAAGPAALIC